MENLTIQVEARSIDKIHIEYVCPVCRPQKNKPVIHRHGSCGDLSNRTEHRGSHCEIFRGNFEINITDNTIRNII